MPELPEVETVRKALEKNLKGRKIANIKILYPKIFVYPNIEEIEKRIKNQTINEINRRGKWLVFKLDDYYLLSHLRMEGKYLYRKENDPIEKHEHVIFCLDDSEELRYHDVRKFGKMYLLNEEELKNSPLNKLGVEPFSKMLTVSYLKEKLKNKNLPIKTVLLDQSIIVGIGNIYDDEILFLSKINPYKKAKDLKNNELDKIIRNTKIILEKAIKLGGSTIHSYTSEEGITGKFQNELLVHTRNNLPCPICNTLIIKEKIGGRGTYYCKNCQK